MSDRRRARRRRSLEEHGIVSARVRPGCEVDLIDVSAGGVLVETTRRLLPGSLIELYLAADGRSVSVRGRVLRCAVARLKSSSVWYRGAIGFERALAWFPEQEAAGYQLPVDESRGTRTKREAATPIEASRC